MDKHASLLFFGIEHYAESFIVQAPEVEEMVPLLLSENHLSETQTVCKDNQSTGTLPPCTRESLQKGKIGTVELRVLTSSVYYLEYIFFFFKTNVS